MVISHLNNLRDKRRAEEARAKEISQARSEATEEGRQEGRQEEREAWIAWNRRRLEAEQAGNTFTEPPPEGQS